VEIKERGMYLLFLTLLFLKTREQCPLFYFLYYPDTLFDTSRFNVLLYIFLTSKEVLSLYSVVLVTAGLEVVKVNETGAVTVSPSS